MLMLSIKHRWRVHQGKATGPAHFQRGHTQKAVTAIHRIHLRNLVNICTIQYKTYDVLYNSTYVHEGGPVTESGPYASRSLPPAGSKAVLLERKMYNRCLKVTHCCHSCLCHQRPLVVQQIFLAMRVRPRASPSHNIARPFPCARGREQVVQRQCEPVNHSSRVGSHAYGIYRVSCCPQSALPCLESRSRQTPRAVKLLACHSNRMLG